MPWWQKGLSVMSTCTQFDNLLPGTRFTWGCEVCRKLFVVPTLPVNAFRVSDWLPVVVPLSAVVEVTPEDLAESVSRLDTERRVGTS